MTVVGNGLTLLRYTGLWVMVNAVEIPRFVGNGLTLLR